MKASENRVRDHGAVGAVPWLSAWLVAVLLAFGPGCAGAQDDGESPLATIAASDRATSELGVATWEIRSKGDDVRVIGRDATSSPRVEMIVRRDASEPDDLVRIETVLPEPGAFELNRAGVVGGTSSDYLRNLGAIVHADLNQNSGTAAAASPQDGLGTTTSALEPWLQAQGAIVMGWSLFGYSWTGPVDGWCNQGVRDHWYAFSSNGSSCWVNYWYSQSPTDCTIQLHYGIAGGHSDVCNWQVYVRPL